MITLQQVAIFEVIDSQKSRSLIAPTPLHFANFSRVVDLCDGNANNKTRGRLRTYGSTQCRERRIGENLVALDLASLCDVNSEEF